MNTQMTRGMQNPLTVKRTLGVLTAAAALAAPSLALADVPVTMAPPVDQSSSSYNSYNSDGSYSGVNGSSNSYNNYNGGNSASSAATSSVFSWQEIPENQRVPIQRAVFDQGGYQLYDNVGETIAVPFANNNLYVMKFAVSPDGSTYFINDGNAPILFLPRNAYLDNASVNGARWYPFSDNFHPSQPVFLGIAPSYDDYCGMGWYPNMFFYGGYYGDAAFGLFTPTIGLFINIGGNHYDGWGGYESYFSYHPDFYRVGYYHPYVYAYAGRQYWGGRTFRGYGGGGYGGGGYAYNHGGYSGNGGFGGNRGFGGGGYGNGGRTFYGAGRPYNTDAHSFGEDRSYGGGHSFGADRSYGNENSSGGFGNRAAGAGQHSFNAGGYQGGRTFRGAGGNSSVQDNDRLGGGGVGRSENQGYQNNDRSYGNDSHTYAGQGRAFNGGGFQNETRTYSNGGSFGHAFTGNGESAPRASSGTFSGGGARPQFQGASNGGGRSSSGGGNNSGGGYGGGGHR